MQLQICVILSIYIFTPSPYNIGKMLQIRDVDVVLKSPHGNIRITTEYYDNEK